MSCVVAFRPVVRIWAVCGKRDTFVPYYSPLYDTALEVRHVRQVPGP